MEDLQNELNDIQEKENFLTKLKRVFNHPVILFGSLICVLLVLILILHYPTKQKPPIYNYKVISYLTNGDNRTGVGALKYASINISDDDLVLLGAQGWELVSTTLEMETSFPNFGNSSYVTGIQSNIRPQRLICIFKRPLNQ